MDCRRFRNQHLGFMDNALPDEEISGMRRHLADCADCAARDTSIRRALLIFRNLPAVQPSPNFAARLNSRIRQLNNAEQLASLHRGPSLGSFVAAAAALVAVGFFAVSAFDWDEPSRGLALEPVLATAPAPAAPLVTSTYVTSASAGTPVWSAAMFAEQVPLHFLNADGR
ncbi:MAG: zf-HC2 domain-containing protein [Anaerolineae bacterium]|nr:zf-HC2 domain-containing protein [Gemmatimonadaceae bacterium]